MRRVRTTHRGLAQVQIDLPLVRGDPQVVRGPVGEDPVAGAPPTPSAGTIWTVGHSTHPLDEFIDLLTAHGITMIADVRRYPGSRKYPHFNADALSAGLAESGIGYAPFPELGGRRPPRPDSPNTAWRNHAFRGYADYMETGAFRAAIDRLTALAREERVAIMCSEAVWWRCHRSLIADSLKAHGYEVLHIMGGGEAREHPYTSAARVVRGEVTYRGS